MPVMGPGIWHAFKVCKLGVVVVGSDPSFLVAPVEGLKPGASGRASATAASKSPRLNAA